MNVTKQSFLITLILFEFFIVINYSKGNNPYFSLIFISSSNSYDFHKSCYFLVFSIDIRPEPAIRITAICAKPHAKPSKRIIIPTEAKIIKITPKQYILDENIFSFRFNIAPSSFSF